MTSAVGVVWYRTGVAQQKRWLQHLLRASEVACEEGGLVSPPSLYSIDNSLRAGEAGAFASLLPPDHDSPVTVLASQANIGFGAAHNRLMATAFADGADLYLCLNPDALLHRRALAELGAAVLPGVTALYEMRQFPTEHPKHYAPDTGDTLWVSGCAVAIPRNVYERIGGFDEHLFMYCEDVDLSWRVRNAGGRCIMVPRALVHHDLANRQPDPLTEHRYLISGHHLATKWSLKELAARLECRMWEVGVPVPAPATETYQAPRIANDAHLFSFSPVRWTL